MCYIFLVCFEIFLCSNEPGYNIQESIGSQGLAPSQTSGTATTQSISTAPQSSTFSFNQSSIPPVGMLPSSQSLTSGLPNPNRFGVYNRQSTQQNVLRTTASGLRYSPYASRSLTTSNLSLETSEIKLLERKLRPELLKVTTTRNVHNLVHFITKELVSAKDINIMAQNLIEAFLNCYQSSVSTKEEKRLRLQNLFQRMVDVINNYRKKYEMEQKLHASQQTGAINQSNIGIFSSIYESNPPSFCRIANPLAFTSESRTTTTAASLLPRSNMQTLCTNLPNPSYPNQYSYHNPIPSTMVGNTSPEQTMPLDLSLAGQRAASDITPTAMPIQTSMISTSLVPTNFSTTNQPESSNIQFPMLSNSKDIYNRSLYLQNPLLYCQALEATRQSSSSAMSSLSYPYKLAEEASGSGTNLPGTTTSQNVFSAGYGQSSSTYTGPEQVMHENVTISRRGRRSSATPELLDSGELVIDEDYVGVETIESE